MVYVNGPHPIIILEFGEELLSNNSNICVIQSNRKWDPAAIEDLRNQIQLQERVLYLHGGTSDVQTPTDDKNAQSELMNDSPKECIKSCVCCKYGDLPLTDPPCCDCNYTHCNFQPKEAKDG